MSRTHRSRRGDEGAALLEMALSLPLLLLVAVGIFEFGRAYQLSQVLTNASREGARIAVLPGSTNTTVTTRVKDYMRAGNLDDTLANVAINRTIPISIGATTVTGSMVTVTYPLNFMVLKPVAELVVHGSTNVGDPLTLTASATMRNE